MSTRAQASSWLLLLAIVTVSCEPSRVRAPLEPEPVAPLVWPAPPAQPRVRYVAAVARPQDLGIRPSFWRRVGEFFVGAREEWFVRPTGVVAKGSRIYVADPGAQAVWILDTEAGRWHTMDDAEGGTLVSPVSVAVGRAGRIYVADSYLARVFMYDADRRPIGSIGDPHLGRPAGLAYDEQRDRLYVADSRVHGVWIFDGDGVALGMIGERGVGEGEFNFPTHLAVDGRGSIYVTDALNFRLQVLAADGTFDAGFGRHGDFPGDFASPKGVGVDSEGHIYVVDALFDAVQIFDRQGRYLLTFGERGVSPGQFWLPGGVFVDRDDRIYVADAYNQRIQIFQYLGGHDDE